MNDKLTLQTCESCMNARKRLGWSRVGLKRTKFKDRGLK